MSGTPVITSRLLSQIGGIRCGVSTRRNAVTSPPSGMNAAVRVGAGVSGVREERGRFLEMLGLGEAELAVPRQCHSGVVVTATGPGEYELCDALTTNRPGLVLAVSVADCAPVFVCDPVRRAVGAIHAGWRGAAERIVERTVRHMVAEYETDPADLVTFIGPCASVCCYEVGPDVALRFSEKYVEERKAAMFLDLKLVLSDQLVGQGVRTSNVEVSPSCTICVPELFHSHRRDRERSGRMVGTICMVH